MKNKELLSNEKYIFLMPETHSATNYIIDTYGKELKMYPNTIFLKKKLMELEYVCRVMN